MKKILKVVGVALCLVAFTQNSQAQFKFSAGADVGFVTNKGLGLSYGLALGGEFLVGDNIGITFHTGYDLVSHEGNGTISLIPLQPGFKYYFSDNTNGLYGHAQIGMTMYRVSFSGYSASSTNLSYAAGLGYLINEHMDLGLRYHIVSADEGGKALNWIALRAAYNF